MHTNFGPTGQPRRTRLRPYVVYAFWAYLRRESWQLPQYRPLGETPFDVLQAPARGNCCGHCNSWKGARTIHFPSFVDSLQQAAA
jgi:hypothetical protein